MARWRTARRTSCKRSPSTIPTAVLSPFLSLTPPLQACPRGRRFSRLDEVIRRLRFHRWRHAERLTPRATLHDTKYTATVAP
jgi:hypothetical protein